MPNGGIFEHSDEMWGTLKTSADFFKKYLIRKTLPRLTGL
jgi:hypothetical protein